jgi:1,4-dihydroxy-2-naphthoate octaprenyltransferase
MKSRIKNWVAELRAPFLTGTVVSVFLGTAIAWAKDNAFSLEFFLPTLVGGVLLHLGANLSNDYFDHKSGNDEVNKEFVRPFSGGSRMIQSGLLTPREVFRGAITLYAFAFLIGLYLTWARGVFVLVLALIGMFSGFSYTFPPFNWASKGVGEALVGLNFGALMTFGAYYIQTQKLAWEPLIASVPVSLLITAVLYINEFPDYAADKVTGKNTLVVRLGRAKAMYGYVSIVICAYAFILLSAIIGSTPPHTLIALLTFPLVVEAARKASRFHSNPFNLAPANALTIATHFLTGILLSASYLAFRFEMASLGGYFVMAIVGICTLFTGYFYMKARSELPRALANKP